MKRILTYLTMATIILSSCRKDKEEVEKQTVSEEETSEVMTKSMESQNSGLNEQLEESTALALAQLSNPLCGVGFDTTIVKTYNSATRSMDYTFNWGYQVNCNGPVPTNVTFNYSSAGNYNSVRMTSQDNATGAIVLTQVNPADTSFKANITYNRSGSQTSKIGNQNTFTSNIEITGSNILIDKTSYEVESGIASFTISGAASDGTSYSFGGTISFLGNRAATIAFNNGNTYSINL